MFNFSSSIYDQYCFLALSRFMGMKYEYIKFRHKNRFKIKTLLTVKPARYCCKYFNSYKESLGYIWINIVMARSSAEVNMDNGWYGWWCHKCQNAAMRNNKSLLTKLYILHDIMYSNIPVNQDKWHYFHGNCNKS